MQNQAADKIDAQIENFLASKSKWNGFPSELGNQYEIDIGADRSRRAILCSIFGLIIYDLFIVADQGLVADIISASFFARFGIVTPMSLLMIAILWRNPSPFVRETFQCVVTVLCVGTILYLMVLSQSPLRIYQHYGVGLVLLYPAVAQRVYFRYLAVTLPICVVMFIIAVYMVPEIPPQARLGAVMILIGTAAFILVGSYNMERQTRLSYVLTLQARRANQRLDITAKTDPLTQLVNRRGLDERIEFMWQTSRAAQRPVAVVMIDIDHFKLFNDRYGHPAGDRCLKEVAQVVRLELRGEEDFAVRYGGEEMLCVLHDTDLSRGLDVAERIRAAIERRAIPHEMSPAARIVTASLGVASVIPEPPVTPAELIEGADAALYAAKRSGRNQVWPRRQASEAPQAEPAAA